MYSYVQISVSRLYGCEHVRVLLSSNTTYNSCVPQLHVQTTLSEPLHGLQLNCHFPPIFKRTELCVMSLASMGVIIVPTKIVYSDPHTNHLPNMSVQNMTCASLST